MIDKNGFRFTVQKSNCLQANVYLKKDLFVRFECEGNHQFGINLSLLLDCLSMLGTHSGNQIALQISYAGEGHPILLQMVDGDGCAPSAVCVPSCLNRGLAATRFIRLRMRERLPYALSLFPAFRAGSPHSTPATTLPPGMPSVICSGGVHPLEKEEPVDFCWDDGKGSLLHPLRTPLQLQEVALWS